MTSSIPPSDPAHARVGQLLKGKYRLEKLLGLGGMAAVYAATHRNGKTVAVKVLHASYAATPIIRERFLREGYVANKVKHRGAVSVLDDDVDDDGTVFLVMELLVGETLHERAKKTGRQMDAIEVLGLAAQLLDVLVAAHAQGIVHRDLKPENMFLTEEGELKILDFGIARLHDGSSATATSTGTTMGTPAFMAPEQARGRSELVDAQTDLWAVGASMFNLLSGRYVHEAATLNELLLAAMTAPAPPLASVVKVPPQIAAVVDHALAYDKKNRWPTAAAMRDAVRDVHRSLTGASLVSMPSSVLATRDALGSLPSAPDVASGAAMPAGAPSPAAPTPISLPVATPPFATPPVSDSRPTSMPTPVALANTGATHVDANAQVTLLHGHSGVTLTPHPERSRLPAVIAAMSIAGVLIGGVAWYATRSPSVTAPADSGSGSSSLPSAPAPSATPATPAAPATSAEPPVVAPATPPTGPTAAAEGAGSSSALPTGSAVAHTPSASPPPMPPTAGKPPKKPSILDRQH